MSQRIGRGLEPPIIDRLNSRIDELRAGGRSIISLAQAVPGFPPPASAQRAAAAALATPDINRYTSDSGILKLREAVAGWLQATADGAVNPATELMIASGANQAFMLAALTILHPGDSALL